MKTQFCGIQKTMAAILVAVGMTASGFAEGTRCFRVDTSDEHVWGHNWPSGNEVTINVGDPAVFVGSAIVEGDGDWSVDAGDHGHDFQAGEWVTVSDGTTTISYTVTSLTITSIDTELDRVYGTAATGSWVRVQIYNDNWTERNVQTDVDGNWEADFSAPSGENSWDAPFDIEVGSEGSACQEDNTSAPYGSTYIEWSVPKPYFHVDPVSDSIWGGEWPTGSVVTVTRGTEPSQLVGTGEVDAWGYWGLWNTASDFQPGVVVTVSNGNTVISHTVTSLTITGIDTELDIVSGTAATGSWVRVEINKDDWSEQIERNVQADGDGNWVADFSEPAGENSEDAAFNIETGTEGNVLQEGDTSVPFGSTWIQWRVANPFFHMNPRSHAIWGRDWPSGEAVEIVVGDPESPDYTATVTTNPDGSWWIEDDDDPVELPAGTMVQATCGEWVKTGIVEVVQVLTVDGDADTISGTADPGCWVWVNIDNADAGREVQADGGGFWVADFSVVAGEESRDETFDISVGTQGNALREDEDGDATLCPWRLSNDTTEVFLAWFEVEGDGPSPYSEFVVELRGSGIVSARVCTPLDDWHELNVDDWWGEDWALYALDSTFETIDAVFPAGEYRLEIVGAGGASTSSVTVAQSLVRPNEMPVIVTPQANVSWPEAYMQWNAPTNANFEATVVQVRDDEEEYDYETQFTDVSISEALVSGLELATDYELNVAFANIQQAETNGIPFDIVRAKFAVMQFTTDSTSDPTLTNRVSWYATKGVERGLGESWEFLEGQDRFGKGMTLEQEYVADTDPADPDSVFRIESVELGPPIAVSVIPSSSARVYTLLRGTNLLEGGWAPVPGQVGLPGGVEPLSDNADPADAFFYRVRVDVP